MHSRSALLFALCSSFVLSLYFFASSIPSLQLQILQTSATAYIPPCRSHSPLRVYMYDLPRRFNVGMFNGRRTNSSAPPDDTPVSAADLPPWPTRSGLNLQHSVEYWMMASLLYDRGEEAVRVSDPEVADVFFVPFFSSLSFNTHGYLMTDRETEIDKQLQVDVVRTLTQSKYWQRSGGRDHVIPMHHPNAFRFHREEVTASILVVVDFGRYPETMSNLRKDVITPYVHVVETYTEDRAQDPYESRPTLLFFRGRTARKDEGIIRAKLSSLLSGHRDVLYEDSIASDDGIKLSTEGMRASRFCLHLAGDTPSSCRLFDAIVSHCIPVIVSDQIELPFEDEIDYTQFAIFLSVKESLQPNYMVDLVRDISKEKWVEMWKYIKQISHHFEFQYPPRKDDAVNMLWRQVRHKLPATTLAVHRSRRLKVPVWLRKRR